MRRALRFVLVAALVVALVTLAGCAAGSERFTDEPAGFWMGLWHGLIIIVTFVIGLFADTVHIYETNNSGGWYDFGFVFGLLIAVGGGCGRRHKKKRRRVCEDDWDEIAERVEAKVRRGIDSWLDERDQGESEWEDVGRKIEEKIKRELKDWAES
ncbi:MAG: hypothetical protein ABIG03_00100 [Candidatus Eisenbacteria bacterium]